MDQHALHTQRQPSKVLLLALWERGDVHTPVSNIPPRAISPKLTAPPKMVSSHRHSSLEPPICASHSASSLPLCA